MVYNSLKMKNEQQTSPISNQNKRAIGEFIGGCDIIKEMYENGEFKKVLEDKRINFKKKD
tara:strand:- start:219 stop:398 length:180 start_codon:yes stop_codon:yes gene_type:complete